ncbi:hypothetical protein Q3G72_002127 [Acer saccharum]|nr:hypothetical protein Q3G72_002127 [Acer saccharum]
MDFSLRIMLLIFACAISQLLILSSAQSCSSYLFPNQNSYRACSDLGVLKSFLHWNYNETTGTIEIAYRHASIKSQTWVAWAINPTRKGMIGSQAFVAHQTSAGIVKAYTSPVTTYSTGLEEGFLSFPVQKISAEFANDEMIIYSTFVLPKNMTTVNHVWQDGPVNEDNSLGMHTLAGENVWSLATLDFLPGQIVATKLGDGSSNLLFKKIHGGLNVISWGILMPIGVMTARYMKVFMDPTWFYAHIICQSSAYAFGIAGAMTGLYIGGKSEGIQFDAHRYIGITLLILGFLQVLALKLRPNKENKYRTYWNIYHHGIGYSVLILSIINIFKGINILEAVMIWKPIYIAILIFFGIIAAILETWTWNIVLNRRLQSPDIK